MAKVLIFSEDIALLAQLITAALEIKSSSILAVVPDTVNTDGIGDVDRIIKFKGDSTWQEDYAKPLADFITQESIDICLVGGSFRGKSIAAKTAAYLRAGLVSSAQSIKLDDDGLITTRLIYGGLAIAEEKTVFPALATIDAQVFAAHETNTATTAESITVQSEKSIAQNIKNIPIKQEGADIATADKVVVVGRGLENKEDLNIIYELAGKLHAEIGCSRGIAEDYHWLPPDRYIGISGKKIKPELYLSAGISGQVQHVAGIRDSKIIAAIDINENAPIFSVADYGIVGDFKEIVPLLIKEL